MDLYRAAIVSGIAVGGTYALVAVGITQIFSVTRVLNFAHAGFTLWGAYLYAQFTYEWGWPVGWSAALTIALVGIMGLASELLVFRYANRATPVNRIILTFGLFLLLSALAAKVWGFEVKAAVPLFPTGSFSVLGTNVSWQQFANLCAVVLVVVGIGAFLRFTRLGLQTRAMAEDNTVAELMAISKNQIGMLNWGLAAMVGGMAGVLAASLQPFTGSVFLQYFLIALTATLVGGLRSLWLTAVGGLLIGVILSVTQVWSSTIGLGTLFVFLGVVALVLLRKHWPSELSKIGWSRPQISKANPGWMVARFVLLGGWLWLILAVYRADFWGQTGALILVYTVAVFSLVPLIGWTGQVSLAQGGFMALGALAMNEAYDYHHLPMAVAVLIAILVGTFGGALVGLICYRLSFVQTTIVTLAFTGVVTQWFMYSHWFHAPSARVSMLVPTFLDSGRSLFLGFVVVTLLVMIVLYNVRRSQWGISFIGVRTAPSMAKHFGLNPPVVRIMAFSLSGAIAAVAGVLYLALVGITDASSFGVGLSLQVLLYAVASGVGSLVGPLIGPLAFLAIPQALNLQKYGSTVWPDILGGLAIIQLMATRPDGMLSILRRPPHLPETRIEHALHHVTRYVPFVSHGGPESPPPPPEAAADAEDIPEPIQEEHEDVDDLVVGPR